MSINEKKKAKVLSTNWPNADKDDIIEVSAHTLKQYPNHLLDIVAQEELKKKSKK